MSNTDKKPYNPPATPIVTGTAVALDSDIIGGPM